MRAPALLLAAGALQSGVGLGLALADSNAMGDGRAAFPHALLLATGLGLAGLAVALALLPAFTRHEAGGAPLAGTVLGAAALLDVLVVPFGFLGAGALALPVLLALPLLAWRGEPLPSAPGPFAQDQPHRVGDRAALVLLLAGAAGLLAGAILLLLPPRGLPLAGLAVLLPALFPLAVGAFAFLLPRLADAPFPGATLLYAALAVLTMGAVGLALAFALPGLGGFRVAAALVLLAELLALVALLRVKLPPALVGPLAHARPLLRGATVLAPLAGVVLVLALLRDAPSLLLPLAAYAHLALAALLLGAALALAAPFLRLAPRGGPGWSKAGAALLLAGLFLLAPAFQYPRSAFPGALVLALGALLVAMPFLRAAPAGAPRPRRRGKR